LVPLLNAWKQEGRIRFVGVTHHELPYFPALAQWVERGALTRLWTCITSIRSRHSRWRDCSRLRRACESSPRYSPVLQTAWKQEGRIRFVGVTHHELPYFPALAQWVERGEIDTATAAGATAPGCGGRASRRRDTRRCSRPCW
jgi:hypothetical protein